MQYKDDTPAIFCTREKAREYADLMEKRPDVRIAVAAHMMRRGEVMGYRVHCKDYNGLDFFLSNDMQERLMEEA